MENRAKFLCLVVAVLPAPVFCAGNDADASIAALESSLGGAHDLEVDEVRLTGDGVACIEYRVRDAAGNQDRGHAVVQGEQVVRSPGDGPHRFEQAWDAHCLGPHGGITTEQ
jgi:hypothetical protein